MVAGSNPGEYTQPGPRIARRVELAQEKLELARKKVELAQKSGGTNLAQKKSIGTEKVGFGTKPVESWRN